MITINFTEFRRNASAIFSSVEGGETIHVMRHGKHIAEISPAYHTSKKLPSWKQQRTKLTMRGKEMTKVIIEERENS